MRYEWVVVNTVTKESISTISNTSVLVLPPFTLSVGRFTVSLIVSYLLLFPYYFRYLTISYPREYNISSVAMTTIEVVHNYIEAKISGGSYRLISVVESFTLDASPSIDNDYPKGRGPPLNFSWSCKMRNGSKCLYQNGSIIDMASTSRIIFDAFSFASDTCILLYCWKNNQTV